MTRSDIDGEGPDPLQLRLFSLEGGERKQEVIALVQAVDNFVRNLLRLKKAHERVKIDWHG